MPSSRWACFTDFLLWRRVLTFMNCLKWLGQQFPRLFLSIFKVHQGNQLTCDWVGWRSVSEFQILLWPLFVVLRVAYKMQLERLRSFHGFSWWGFALTAARPHAWGKESTWNNLLLSIASGSWGWLEIRPLNTLNFCYLQSKIGIFVGAGCGSQETVL